MLHYWRQAVLVGLFFAAISCQGVQPGSTPGSSMQETGSSMTIRADINEKDINLRLDAVNGERPVMSLQTRNPFQFSLSAEVLPEAEDEVSEVVFPAVSVAEIIPADQLRMVGLVKREEDRTVIAVFSKGEEMFYGGVGDVVEGRHRIISIGPMSVEVETIEDGARQVLSLGHP